MGGGGGEYLEIGLYGKDGADGFCGIGSSCCGRNLPCLVVSCTTVIPLIIDIYPNQQQPTNQHSHQYHPNIVRRKVDGSKVAQTKASTSKKPPQKKKDK